MASTLIAHKGSQKVSYDVIRALPAPLALGPRHTPVAHYRVIDAIEAEAANRGLAIERREFALQRDGGQAFGVYDFRNARTDVAEFEGALSFGFRSSTDQALALRGVAGSRVFVCDNLVFNGSTIALARKHTSGINLVREIRLGFDKFLGQAETLAAQLQQLAGQRLTDDEAKVLVFDAFAKRFLPARLFDDVNELYFHATDATPDTQPRTAWGLHNAFTRSLKALTPARQFEATVALGQHFRLGV